LFPDRPGLSVNLFKPSLKERQDGLIAQLINGSKTTRQQYQIEMWTILIIKVGRIQR